MAEVTVKGLRHGDSDKLCGAWALTVPAGAAPLEVSVIPPTAHGRSPLPQAAAGYANRKGLERNIVFEIVWRRRFAARLGAILAATG